MLKFLKFSIILLLLFNIFSVFILTTHAEETTIIGKAECTNYKCNTGDASERGKICCGNYSLNDMVSVAVKISTFILGIVGSLALLAFVAGGMMWTLSAGNPEWVTRGKQTIIGAVVGLVIVFTSYMIITLVYNALGINFTGESEFPTQIQSSSGAKPSTPSQPTTATQNNSSPEAQQIQLCRQCATDHAHCLTSYDSNSPDPVAEIQKCSDQFTACQISNSCDKITGKIY